MLILLVAIQSKRVVIYKEIRLLYADSLRNSESKFDSIRFKCIAVYDKNVNAGDSLNVKMFLTINGSKNSKLAKPYFLISSSNKMNDENGNKVDALQFKSNEFKIKVDDNLGFDTIAGVGVYKLPIKNKEIAYPFIIVYKKVKNEHF